MRIGCCGSMISPKADPVGIDIIDDLVQLGFDYIELSMADVAALRDEQFADLRRRVEQSGIACEACNNFFPPTMRLTGPEAKLSQALDYVSRALDRAAALGAKIVVFGSAVAKNVPQGFPHDDAMKQIVELLAHMGPIAQRVGIVIPIEPINRGECNIINFASQGLELARQIHHPNIQLLIDYYHLKLEAEDPAIILRAGDAIRHVHFAKIENRVFPTEPDPDYAAFFDCLRRIGYSGRCSIEAYSQDFTNDAKRALGVLKQLTK
jgi:sugar phosphate isomerase/epimerase